MLQIKANLHTYPGKQQQRRTGIKIKRHKQKLCVKFFIRTFTPAHSFDHSHSFHKVTVFAFCCVHCSYSQKPEFLVNDYRSSSRHQHLSTMEFFTFMSFYLLRKWYLSYRIIEEKKFTCVINTL